MKVFLLQYINLYTGAQVAFEQEHILKREKCSHVKSKNYFQSDTKKEKYVIATVVKFSKVDKMFLMINI